MNAAWVLVAAAVALAASSNADDFVGARQYGLPGVARSEPVPKGYFKPLPPGARAYFARPEEGARRLFADPAEAVADLPEGEYKLFYTPPAVPMPEPARALPQPEPARAYGLPGAARKVYRF